MSRTVRVRLPIRLPRPLSGEEVDALLASMTTLRDLALAAMVITPLGLSPEVIGGVLTLGLGVLIPIALRMMKWIQA